MPRPPARFRASSRSSTRPTCPTSASRSGSCSRPRAEAEGVLQPLLARDVVRYVGEPVALVVAEDPWTAEDAAELVELDLDPLPVAADLATAAAGERAVHDHVPSNVVNTIPTRFGDVEAASAGADVRISQAPHGAAPHGRAHGDARARRRLRRGRGRAHALGRRQGEALQPRRDRRAARSRGGRGQARRGRRRRRLRRARRALPRGRPRPLRGAAPRAPRQVDRGSRRAPRGRESRARAGARDRGDRDRRRPPADACAARTGAIRARTCARRASCRRCFRPITSPGRTAGTRSRSTPTPCSRTARPSARIARPG